MAAAKRGHTYVAEALKAFMQTTGEDPEEARHVQLQPSPEIERLDASINHLRACEVLDLSGNRISQMISMPGPRCLRVLSLARNRLDRVRGLEDHPQLEELDLAGNRLATLDGIAACPALAALDVSDNAVADGRELAKLPGSLRSLALRSNPVCAAFLDAGDLVRRYLPRVDVVDGEPLESVGDTFREFFRASAPGAWTETVLAPRWPAGFLGDDAVCDGEPMYAYGESGFLGDYLQALHGDADEREYAVAGGGAWERATGRLSQRAAWNFANHADRRGVPRAEAARRCVATLRALLADAEDAICDECAARGRGRCACADDDDAAAEFAGTFDEFAQRGFARPPAPAEAPAEAPAPADCGT